MSDLAAAAAAAVLAPGADDLTPRRIVAELDRYVVGQAKAKRSVAIALRNRERRLRLPPGMREDVHPKNIILIGPTGVGKTEIARRLARLARSPFVKVEASKYTEVGYVGRDAESMVRDLVDVAIKQVREEMTQGVAARARAAAEERLLDALLPRGAKVDVLDADREAAVGATREKLRDQLRRGVLDERRVEIDVQERSFPALQVFTPSGMEEMDVNLREALPGLFGGRSRKRTVKVAEAWTVLAREEESRLVDGEAVTRDAIARVETCGIVFLDEIDKIAGREGSGRGPDVSREGVQRDLLPIVEGTSVSTKYGPVRTDHVLFIAAGAFHVSKPSDLIPELQGRFPIRVELETLGKDEFVRILTEPQNALLRQVEALLATEGIELSFSAEAIDLIAGYATIANDRGENIGARRLHTVVEHLLEEISFAGPDLEPKTVRIDGAYVRERLASVIDDPQLARFIL